MDDFILSNLNESRNEWCARLISIFTPLVLEGIRSIFDEAWTICLANKETGKYLMTFQNLLSRIPQWNSTIIEDERKRIIERSGCNYLEDLITCVHIIQLKILTCIRVGTRQKKIDISIPKLDGFIHKIYIHAARKCYVNVDLFEKTKNHLQYQKNNRELEMIIQECILMSIRESIPTESIIRAYLDQSVEQEEEVIIERVDPIQEKPVEEDSKKNILPESSSMLDIQSTKAIEPQEPVKDTKFDKPLIAFKDEIIPEVVPSITNVSNEPVTTRLTFNDYDSILHEDGKHEEKEVSKTIENLEKISMDKMLKQSMQEDDEDSLLIGEDVDIGLGDIMEISNTLPNSLLR